jgi:hypothetical protein
MIATLNSFADIATIRTARISTGAQMELLIALCLVGVFFGVYCHFLVLVPLTLATATACSMFAAWYGQTIFETLLTILILAVALQGGYMIGLTSREFLVPSKRI